MNRQKKLIPKLVLATVGAAFFLLFAFGAQASLISSFHHSYDSDSIFIDLSVFDAQPGGRFLWEYTVTNNSYDPNPGVTNGFSGFELFLPSPIPEIADITPNGTSSPPWEINCCSGNPVEWDIRNSAGNGIMPGNSGVFSFTTDPRVVAINNNGWFHTWQGGQTNIVTTIGMHVPLVPGLAPAVPEPEILGLFAIGFMALGFVRRRRLHTV